MEQVREQLKMEAEIEARLAMRKKLEEKERESALMERERLKLQLQTLAKGVNVLSEIHERMRQEVFRGDASPIRSTRVMAAQPFFEDDPE
jgi:hypothetical protein